jgi:hypothetical protein
MHQPAGDSFDYSGRKYQKYSSNYITETGYSADTMLDSVTNTVPSTHYHGGQSADYNMGHSHDYGAIQ